MPDFSLLVQGVALFTNAPQAAVVQVAEGTMKLRVGLGAMIVLLSLVPAGAGTAEEKMVTWTGWFSDVKCASARAAGGTFSATNPDCARTCIENGAAAVFISEQARAVFNVKEYSSVVDDLGYQVEVHGMVDGAGKTIRVREVKRLEYQGAACARPKKK